MFQPSRRSLTQLTWFDRHGQAIGTVGDPASQRTPVLSPSDSEVAIDQPGGIRIIDVRSGVARRMTTDPVTESNSETYSVWSPTGDRLVFASRRKGRMDLYEADMTRPSASAVLRADNLDKFPASRSPDGSALLFQAVSPDTGADVWLLPLTGDGHTARPFIKTAGSERQARFSPDGRWVAYTSDESGRSEVYVAPFPGPGRPQPISSGGGDAPHWRRDGKELKIFFVTPDKSLSAAILNTTSGRAIVLGIERLFQIQTDDVVTSAFDVAADGQRFLVASPVGSARPPALSLVVNWPATLRR